MCVVSMVTDHYIDRWPRRYPTDPWNNPQLPSPTTPQIDITEWLKPKPAAPTAEEIQEFRELLERAREYDKRNNEPHCENADKVKILKELAAAWGIDISFAYEQ